MQKNKSILNQKCDDCGSPIDYFELRGHIIKEDLWKSIKSFKLVSLIAIIGSIVLIFINVNVILTSFGIGTFFGMLIMFYSEVKFQKNYKPNKIKKKFYHSKVRWNYYKSLSKRKRNKLISKMMQYISIALLPYILIVIVGIGIIESIEISITQKVIASFLLLVIYYTLLVIDLKLDLLKGYCQDKLIKELAKEGIDYQRLNKGVKSK